MERRTSAALLVTAWTMKVDAVTAQVVGAFEDAGIPCLLLKGPVFREWLYDDGALRPYTDTDLLVPAEALPDVERTLATLGFEDYSRDGIAGDRPLHALTFMRAADEAHVDVHTTLNGAGAPAADVWRELSSQTETCRVGGRDVRVPARPALALHVALHAAQHGAAEARPLEDLRRALARSDDEVWRRARDLAATLDAGGPLSVGLGLVPEGAALRAGLGIADAETTPIARLRATTPPPIARGFEWLAGRPGLRAKAAFVVRKLFPPPEFMRRWTPLARRGRAGLLLSYPWRLLWLVRHAPAGFRAWLEVRR